MFNGFDHLKGGGGQTIIRIRLRVRSAVMCWWIVGTIDTRLSVVYGFSKNFVSEVKSWRVTQFSTESDYSPIRSPSDNSYRFDFNLTFLFFSFRFVQPPLSLLSLSGSTNNSSSRFLVSPWPISPLLLLVHCVYRKRLSSLWSCLSDEISMIICGPFLSFVHIIRRPLSLKTMRLLYSRRMNRSSRNVSKGFWQCLTLDENSCIFNGHLKMPVDRQTFWFLRPIINLEIY